MSFCVGSLIDSPLGCKPSSAHTEKGAGHSLGQESALKGLAVMDEAIVPMHRRSTILQGVPHISGMEVFSRG